MQDFGFFAVESDFVNNIVSTSNNVLLLRDLLARLSNPVDGESNEARRLVLFEKVAKLWLLASCAGMQNGILTVDIWDAADWGAGRSGLRTLLRVMSDLSNLESVLSIKGLKFKGKNREYCSLVLRDLLVGCPPNFFRNLNISYIDFSSVCLEEDRCGPGWNASLYAFVADLKMSRPDGPSLVINLGGLPYCRRVNPVYISELRAACYLSRLGENFSGRPLLDICTRWGWYDYPYGVKPTLYSATDYDYKMGSPDYISTKIFSEYHDRMPDAVTDTATDAVMIRPFMA